jgi:hypothetical protein
VEYRVVDVNGAAGVGGAGGGALMPLINLMKTPQTIVLPPRFAGATDLLSGKPVSATIELSPMVPLLLRVETK